MPETYTHKCIKAGCSNTYTDKDPDAFFCQTCNEQRKAIAKQIDAKFSTARKPVESELQKYDRLRKQFGTKFIPLKSL